MKVGYILTTFPCRSETFAQAEIEALRGLGFDITVFAARRSEAGRDEADTKTFYRPSVLSREAVFAVVYLLVRRPLALGRLILLALSLIRSCPREALSVIGNLHTIGSFAGQVDRRAISHIHAYFLSWPAAIGLALSAATRRPLSISAHARDIFVERGAAELKISHARFVAVCTRQGLEYLKSNLSARYHPRLHLCYHGTKRADGRRPLKDRYTAHFGSGQFLLAIGRMVPKKGLAILLRAFGLVVLQKPDSRLMIVGDGPDREQLQTLRDQLGLKDHVQLLQWQQPDVVLERLRCAAALVVPSIVAPDGDRDGIPNAILEAFAAGTPVIASNLEGIREAVEHGRTGLLVEAADVTQLAAAIEKLLNDRDLWNRLSQAAYEVAAARFDYLENARKIADLFAAVK